MWWYRLDLWRISRFQDLDGEGGLKASGRWHTKGSRIVYLSESPACALLEHLAHVDFDPDELPVSFTLLRIEAPDSLSRLNIQEDDLPEAWREDDDTGRGRPVAGATAGSLHGLPVSSRTAHLQLGVEPGPPAGEPGPSRRSH